MGVYGSRLRWGGRLMGIGLLLFVSLLGIGLGWCLFFLFCLLFGVVGLLLGRLFLVLLVWRGGVRGLGLL